MSNPLYQLNNGDWVRLQNVTSIAFRAKKTVWAPVARLEHDQPSLCVPAAVVIRVDGMDHECTFRDDRSAYIYRDQLADKVNSRN